MSDLQSYRTIAVASTFSPRFVQVLSEAKRIRERFDCEMRLIYVGERTDETEKKFAGVLSELQLPSDCTIYYQQGDPAVAILDAVHKNHIDMIVAVALEKEVVLRPFLGNVARRLVRESTCSVLLFTKPESPPQQLRTIVFIAADYSEHSRDALKKTLQLAAAEHAEKFFVVRIFTTFDEARAALKASSPELEDQSPRTVEAEEHVLEEFILSAGATEVPIEARCIRGNTGFAASEFVHSVKADLLAVPVRPESHGGGGLPANVAWITDVIPCNLLVIR